jgi:hypothetical protein
MAKTSKKTTTKKTKTSKETPSSSSSPRASTTKTFLKSRVSKPTLGKWSSGFSTVKKYAEDNNVPLIAVWSNGDACGHCTTFETAVMNSKFVKWMSTSKCVFWFGCSSDTSKDDKLNGAGYTWAWKNQSLKLYPFVRIYWKSGKVDKAESGDYWIDHKSSGYSTFIKKLESLLKAYFTPTTTTPPVETSNNNETTNTTTPTTESCESCSSGICSDDGCSTSNSCCSEEEYNNLKSTVNSLVEKVDMLTGLANSYLAQIQQKEMEISKLKETLENFIADIQGLVGNVELSLES